MRGPTDKRYTIRSSESSCGLSLSFKLLSTNTLPMWHVIVNKAFCSSVKFLFNHLKMLLPISYIWFKTTKCKQLEIPSICCPCVCDRKIHLPVSLVSATHVTPHRRTFRLGIQALRKEPWQRAGAT